MEHSTQKLFSEKIKIFVTVEPFNIRLAALFNANEQISAIKTFVQNKMKHLGIKFFLGRLELKDKLAILLPEFHIGDFLENDSEVVAYSQDYGLNMRTLPGDGMDQRPFFQKVHLLYEESSFTKKKTNRNNNNHNKNKKNENNKKPKVEGNQNNKQEKKNDNKNEKKKENNKQEKKEVKNETKKEDSNKKEKSKKEEELEDIKKLKKANQKMKSEKKEKQHNEYVKDSDDEAESS